MRNSVSNVEDMVFNSMKENISSLREKIFDAVAGRTVDTLQGT
jgi:hypothetical protein